MLRLIERIWLNLANLAAITPVSLGRGGVMTPHGLRRPEILLHLSACIRTTGHD